MGVRRGGGDDPGLCGGIFSVGFAGLCEVGGGVWVGDAGACGSGVGGVFVGFCEFLLYFTNESILHRSSPLYPIKLPAPY